MGEVMGREPYKSARRVFWIRDNCSEHRGQKAVDGFHAQWPNAILVHTPFHASWLNRIEIFFSIVQRKASLRMISLLGPNSNSDSWLFQPHSEQTARPCKWIFTRSDLRALLAKINAKLLALAA